MYDVTSEKSFENMDIWAKEMKENVTDGVKCILVGNKFDSPNRIVSTDDSVKLASNLGIDVAIETSTKDDINVDKVFYTISRLILISKQEQKEKEDLYNKTNKGVKLDDPGVKSRSCFMRRRKAKKK